MFMAFHIVSQKKFGKTTPFPQSGRKIESLQEFRNFNSLKFGEFIVPRLGIDDLTYMGKYCL